MNGMETYVGNSDCRYITRFKVIVFDAEKCVQKLCKFGPVTFCSICNNTGAI